MAQQVVTELVIDARGAAAGAAAYDAAMKKAEAAAGRVAAVNDNARSAIERSTVTMTQSAGRQAAAWNRMAAGADAVTAARLQLEKAQRAGAAVMALDASKAEEVASTLAVYRARLDAASTAAGRGAASTALNSGQVQNLTFQLNDMATMLASGQSPFVMLMQQGMQMAQVFGPGVGVGGALKATGAALVSFLTNPLTLAVAGMAAAAGAVSLLWDAVSSSASAERALEEHKALIDDIRDAYGEAGEAATRYAAKSAEVLQFRTDNTLSDEMKVLNEELDKFARMYEPGFGDIMISFGALDPMVQEFTQSIRDGNADVAAFERSLAAVGNATDDIDTDAAVAQLLALLDPLLKLEQQARQTAGATQLFAGTLVTLGRTGTLRFADAFGDLDAMKSDLQGFIDAEAEAAKKAKEAAKALDGVSEVPLPRLRPEIDNIAKGLERAEGAAKNFITALVGGVGRGESVMGSLGTAIAGLTSTLGASLGDKVSGLIGGATSGIFGSILSGLGGGLVSTIVSGIGGLFDSIFGNDDAEREAEREQRRAERRLKAQERRDRIDARRERLEEQEERRLARQEARARRLEGWADRAFVAGLDTSTLGGAMAQLEREQQREREEVARTAGKQVNNELRALAVAHNAEMLALQRQFNQEAVAEAERAQDEMNRSARTVVDYIQELLAGPQSTQSPQNRFAASQTAFNSQYALALGGNAEALAGITKFAEDFRLAAREMYASAPQYQAIQSSIIQKLLALPAVQQTTDPLVAAMAAMQNAIVSAVGTMQTTLAAAINAGPAATAAALGPVFEDIDVNASGGISFAEMQAALGPTNTNLASIFTKLDTNNNGQITKLELIRAQMAATAANTAGVSGLLTQTQLQSLGLSTDTKLGTLLTSSQLSLLNLAKDATIGTIINNPNGLKDVITKLGNVTVGTLFGATTLATLGIASDAKIGTLLTDANGLGKILAGLTSATSGLPAINAGVGNVAKDATLTSTTGNLALIKTNTGGIASVNANLTSATGNLGLIKTNTGGIATVNTNLTSTTGNLGLIKTSVTGVSKDTSLKSQSSGYTVADSVLNMEQTMVGVNSTQHTLTSTVASLLQAVNKLRNSLAQGGTVPRYAEGGTVGNGVFNVDSVRARYAGGGDIMLAGGEFVTRATSVNAFTMPILDAINRTGRPASIASVVANDNGRYFADQNRVLIAGFRAMIEALQSEITMLRAEVRRTGDGTTRAVERKPVARPAAMRA